MRIEPLGPERIPDVHEVWRAAGLHHRANGRDAVESMRGELERGSGFLLGAFVDETLVGVVLGTDDGRKGWINRLAVLPGHRRGGIGVALIEACEAELERRGIGLAACLVEAGNEASVDLFEAAGYTSYDIVYLRKPLRDTEW